MRRCIVALVVIALSGTLACSKLEPPTAPTASMLTSPNAATLGRVDPLDISGSWVTREFLYWATLPGTDGSVRCESYAWIENEEWNSVLLEQNGTHIVGTSRPGMGISCWGWTPDGGSYSFIDIDDTFQGQVVGNEVRLWLNKYIEARLAPDGNGGWSGTIRVRIDPRPLAEPYWVEQPFDLRTTTTYPCWWVHLEPPYCSDFP
jgi:hypothetical protein